MDVYETEDGLAQLRTDGKIAQWFERDTVDDEWILISTLHRMGA